jgi:predicted secreted protein
MKARSLLLVFLLSLCTIAASAGDICTFVNLGFSADSKNFMFGLYGVHGRDNIPYAEAYIVDVPNNRFLPGGQLISLGSKPVTLGQDGSGALYNILHTIKPQIDTYRIDHLEVGRLIYILVNGQEAKNKLSFRDFNTNANYELTLTQKSRQVAAKAGEAATTEAAFNITLVIHKTDGTDKTVTAGNPNLYRDSVETYVVRQVVLSPDENNIVFVVEKQDRSKGSLQTSYMVETVSLK